MAFVVFVNVRGENEREKRALEAKTKRKRRRRRIKEREKSGKGNGKREGRNWKGRRERSEKGKRKDGRDCGDALLGLHRWDWPLTDTAAERPLVPDLVQYGSHGQIFEVS